jgi:hypothetical protein
MRASSFFDCWWALFGNRAAEIKRAEYPVTRLQFEVNACVRACQVFAGLKDEKSENQDIARVLRSGISGASGVKEVKNGGGNGTWHWIARLEDKQKLALTLWCVVSSNLTVHLSCRLVASL